MVAASAFVPVGKSAGAFVEDEDRYGKPQRSDRLHLVRERLTPAEIKLVRYVLGEWAGDSGGSTRWAEMMREEEVSRDAERLSKAASKAAKELRRMLRLRSPLEVRQAAWARSDERLRRYCQEMHCSGGGPSSKLGAIDSNGYPLLEGAEIWASRGHKKAGEIIQAWRAVTSLDADRPDLAAVLVRLYGGQLPGDRIYNPFVHAYTPDLAHEYSLVIDCVGMGTWRQFSEALKKKDTDTKEVTVMKAKIMAEGAKRSEKIIVAATQGYRDKLAATAQEAREVTKTSRERMPALVMREEVPVGMMGAVRP